jgi:hypothetical protein
MIPEHQDGAGAVPPDAGKQGRKGSPSRRPTSCSGVEEARKVLTLNQPLASAIVLGLTNRIVCQRVVRYRGPLLIHAGCRHVAEEESSFTGLDPDRLPHAAIVGLVDLLGCVPQGQGTGYEWFLANPRPLVQPVSWKGQLFLWTRPADLVLPRTAFAHQREAGG